MSIMGPVQMLVIAFDEDHTASVRAEIDRLRADAAIRLLDALHVGKDDAGAVHVNAFPDDTPDDPPGTFLVPLLDGETADLGHLEGIAEDELWDVATALPTGSAAAVLLIEHQWAVGLSNAVRQSGVEHVL